MLSYNYDFSGHIDREKLLRIEMSQGNSAAETGPGALSNVKSILVYPKLNFKLGPLAKEYVGPYLCLKARWAIQKSHKNGLFYSCLSYTPVSSIFSPVQCPITKCIRANT